MQFINRMTPGTTLDSDTQMRLKAFARVRQLSEIYGHLRKRELDTGFDYEGENIPIHHKAGRGIHKPKQMRHLLSVKTVIPKPGGRVWYEDQLTAHNNIFTENESIDYAFMGQNPDAAENQWLREAFELQIPIIYYLGVAPGRYQVVVPTFIGSWDRNALKVKLVFGDPTQNVLSPPEHPTERRYALRVVKQRLHQSKFREAVIQAYRGRCAVSKLCEPQLLDAAHIIPDRDDEFGHAVVSNGLTLSKIHHAAFDANLLGIDPDYKIHLSERLLDQEDGPMLELLKGFHGKTILLPKREKDYPDKERLDRRYEQFKSAA